MNSWRDWRDTKLAKNNPAKNNSPEYSVENCLKKILDKKEADNDWLKELIYQRFQQRFISPLKHLIKNAKKPDEDYVAVGFTIMAIASLMIETLACFRYGQWTTNHGRGNKKNNLERLDPRWLEGHIPHWKSGNDIFKSFLSDANNCFNSNETLFNEGQAGDFYSEIRCGILHQAETKGKWRILKWKKAEPAVKRNPNIIYAVPFLDLLEKETSRYIQNLGDKKNESVWKACHYKLLGICANSGWDGKWPIDTEQKVNFLTYW